MAGKKTIGELSVILGADTQVFEKKMGKSKSELESFAGSAKSMVSKISSAFAGLAAVGLSLNFVKESIQSVEGPGDDFNKIMAGGKEALFELQKAVATVDFSNLVDNLVKGFTRGKEFEGAIDDLADKVAYNDFKISELNRESKRLQEITKNKELEISVRKDAAVKLEIVEKQILERKKKLSQEAYDIEAKNWSDKNAAGKIGVDEAIRLYEVYNSLTERQKLALEELFADKTWSYNLKDPDALIGGFTRQEMSDFASYSKLIAEGEADVIIKLFALKSKAADEMSEAQERYNSILKQTSTLAIKETSETSASPTGNVGSFSYGKFGSLMSAELENQLGSLTDPTLPQRVSENFKALSDGMTPELEKIKASIQDFTTSLNASFEQFLEGAISTLGAEIGAALVTGDWENFGNAILSVVGKFAQQFGSLLIAYAISVSAFEESFGNPVAALAAGVALVAIGGALSQLGSQGPTASGSSGGSYAAASSPYSYSNNNSNHTIELHWRRVGRDLVAILNDENTSNRVLTGKR